MRGRQPLSRIARTYAYRAFTNLSPDRIDAMRRGESGTGPLRIAQRLLGGGEVTVAEGPAAGLLLSTDHLPLTHIQAFGLVRGALEQAVQEALRRSVAPGSVVFDVGANVGFFSLFAARLTGPGGRVEAFEPSPVNAEALRQNVRLNAMEDVVGVHELAVAAAAGTARFLHTDDHSWSHLEDRGWHPRTKEVIEVRVVALDELVESGLLPAPDVVQLDVEGSELAALAGMERTLRSARPIVICELHETGAEFDAFMRGLGYEIENLDAPGPIPATGPGYALARPAR